MSPKTNANSTKSTLKVLIARSMSELVSKVNSYNQQENVSSITNDSIVALRKENDAFFLLFFSI